MKHELSCLAAQFAVVRTASKEVLRWLGLSVRICDAILRGNYDQMLIRMGLDRQVDRRKVSYLFKGWGDSNCSKYEEVMNDISKQVSNERMLFWRKKEEALRDEAREYFARVNMLISGVYSSKVLLFFPSGNLPVLNV